MDQESINILLAGRAIIDSSKQERIGLSHQSQEYSDSVLRMNAELFKLGFGYEENPISPAWYFLQINTLMRLQMLKEYNPIQGFCDECKGNIDLNTGLETGPMCEKVYGKKFCDQNAIDNKIVPDWLYDRISLSLRTDMMKTESSKRGCCPKGHGFYVDELKCKRPFPFDPFWQNILYSIEEKNFLRSIYLESFNN